jgi:hypothetical protein
VSALVATATRKPVPNRMHGVAAAAVLSRTKTAWLFPLVAS